MRDGALDRNGNGVGSEMAVSEKGHLSIFAKQINKTIRLSIKRDNSWVDLKFFLFHRCLTFCSHDNLFRHTQWNETVALVTDYDLNTL